MPADRDLDSCRPCPACPGTGGQAREGEAVHDDPGVIDPPGIRFDQGARAAGAGLLDRRHLPRRTGHELL